MKNKYSLRDVVMFECRTNSPIRAWKQVKGYIGGMFLKQGDIVYLIYEMGSPDKFKEIKESDIIGLADE